MNKSTKYFTVIAIIFILFISSFGISLYLEHKNIVIEDIVINVDLQHSEYMKVTFNNSGTYNIRYPSESDIIDFTINSKMKIRLDYMSSWCFPNNDNVWRIVQIVKYQ